MRKTFHVAVIIVLGVLIADRALLHANGREASTFACAQGAEQVKLDAMDRGFDDAAASSQGAAFRSGCLVSGRGTQQTVLARN